jgi:uncharacterized membrane protein YhiD involved in acid resistance
MFLNIIKDSIVEQFTGTLSIDEMVLSLITAFIIGLMIVFVYRKTYTGVVYSKSFSLCIIILAMVTALIIRTVNSNLALSLGMVGALSIVRFRTAVKEPVDTGFMFWGISAGIMAGTGMYLIAVIASLALGLLYFVGYLMGFKVRSQYLLVLKYNLNCEDEIKRLLKKLPKHKLKSHTITKDLVELTFEVDIKDQDETNLVETFNRIDGVVVASLISYQNDFGD